ncbi:MAG: hypothetical protein R6X02_16630 [Enhygromyxa sp.]
MNDAISDDPGKSAEDLIERICHRAFFSDFVVRDPKYKNPSGKELEAADVLVLFGTEAVTIQVKARPKARKDSETEEVYHQRLRNKIEEGAKQVPALIRALRTGGLTEVTTARGLVVPVDADKIQTIRGIVVLDLPAERALPEENKSTLYAGVSEFSGVLVHAFLSDEFDTMLEELDTLPDFLAYLGFRERMYGADKLSPFTHNLDLLAFYKIHHDLRDDADKHDIGLFIIAEGMWEHYVEAYAEPRRRRRKLDEPSFFVDKAIEFLDAAFTGHEEESGDEWLLMARELASFTRLQRRLIGGKWRAAMDRAVAKGSAFTVCRFDEKPDEAFIVYAGPEESRGEFLKFLASVAYVKFSLCRVVAFGAAPIDAATTTMQMVLMEDVVFDDEDVPKLDAAGQQIFGVQKYFTGHEYWPDERKQVKRVGPWRRRTKNSRSR